MKQINLLPRRIIQRQRLSLLVAAAATGLVLALVALAGLWGFWRVETKAAQDETAHLREVAAEQKNQAGDQEARKEALSQKISLINTFSKAELNWSTVLSTTDALIPHDVQLNSLSYATATGLVIKMGGSASTNVSFASFVQSLQASSQLQAVKVDSYTFDPKTGGVTFLISAKVTANGLTYPNK